MLRLTNTLIRSLQQVEPVEPGRVKMYSCGPTVYRYAHVGNLRAFTFADLVRRVLRYQGLEVTAVMNITDVGHMTDELTDSGRDRMELAASDEGRSPTEIATFYTEAFLRDCDTVGIGRFDSYPLASEHVDQMVELTARLLERGHAYEVDGNVYFDVSSYPGYGELSGQSPEHVRPGHRVTIDAAKRSHQDFLLWKAAGPHRLVKFDSPWGVGYPGWHVECSAMSMHLLGDRIDVHTGGVDNVFPHHEAERAQSDAAAGHSVVTTWAHCDHLLVDAARMSKSAGNVMTVTDLVDAGHDPLALRYLYFTARYRRQVGFTPQALEAAGTALRRLRERIAALGPHSVVAPRTEAGVREVITDPGALAYHRRFTAAVYEDLDLPNALPVLHEMLSDPSVAEVDRRMLAGSWDSVLGLGLEAGGELPPELESLVARRDRARADRDFALADAIRDRLASAGVELVDTPQGTRWVRSSGGPG